MYEERRNPLISLPASFSSFAPIYYLFVLFLDNTYSSPSSRGIVRRRIHILCYGAISLVVAFFLCRPTCSVEH